MTFGELASKYGLTVERANKALAGQWPEYSADREISDTTANDMRPFLENAAAHDDAKGHWYTR